MSFLSRIPAAFRVLTGKYSRRGFDGTRGGRLFADWFASATSADEEIRGSIRKLIDRSRDHERNNDYQRGYLGSCERNIIGSAKFDLRMDCGDYKFTPDGGREFRPDRLANNLIEEAWGEWSKKGACTVCGQYSWRDVKRMLVRAVPRDGNFLATKVTGPAARNRFGFALRIWEIDHLDLQKFDVRRDGSETRFGIEYDTDFRPVAYWLHVRHPGASFGSGNNAPSVRISAAEIYHVFKPDRVGQSIGYPWIVAGITRLRQLGMFEEAAVVAARVGASQMAFFEKEPGPNGELGEYDGETDANGAPVVEMNPGTSVALPTGWKVSGYKPEYPNISTGEFRKAMLRGICTGIGTSYITVGNDLESVNLSSARLGLQEEREGWKSDQLFYSEHFYEPVFADWLEWSLLNRAINLPPGKFSKFNRPVFKQRRWSYMDPLKEVQAAKEAINLRVSSRRQIVEENGGDIEETFHDNADDEKLAESIGLDLTPNFDTPAEAAAAGGNRPQAQNQNPDEDHEDDKVDSERALNGKAHKTATVTASDRFKL